MTKPDMNNNALYNVTVTESVHIDVRRFGDTLPPKAAVDGLNLREPFQFPVSSPPGGRHIAAVECSFPPQCALGSRCEISVRGRLDGQPNGEFFVTSIFPDSEPKDIGLTFRVV